MIPRSGSKPASHSLVTESGRFDLCKGNPCSLATSATSDSVSVPLLPVGASIRVSTPTTSCLAFRSASKVLAALAGVPAKIILK